MTDDQPKKTFNVNGTQVTGVLMRIEHRAEGPCVYTLGNGGKLEVSLKVHQLFLLEGQKSANGEQLFSFSFDIEAKYRPVEGAS